MKNIRLSGVLRGISFIILILAATACKNPSTAANTYADISSPNIGLLKVVPAGSFQRDSISTNISVVTTAFRMSEHEITRTQFLAIMGTDPSNTGYSSGTGDPVQMVNWYQAIAFCNKLSIAEGLTKVYSVTESGTPVDFSTLVFGNIPVISDSDWNTATADWSAIGYRLPTEMEWMWAAMGATSGSDYTEPVYLTGYVKAFAGSNGSNVIGDYAVFGYSGIEAGRTTTERSNPVGSKEANELGLYDMSGNVWQWNWDWDAVYPTGTIYSNTATGRGVDSGTHRMIRGGSWYYDSSNCTVSDRDDSIPYDQYYYIGFRVVLP